MDYKTESRTSSTEKLETKQEQEQEQELDVEFFEQLTPEEKESRRIHLENKEAKRILMNEKYKNCY